MLWQILKEATINGFFVFAGSFVFNLIATKIY